MRPRSYDGQEQDEKTGVRSKCALQIQSPSTYIRIAIARGAGMPTTTVERTTVNSPFTNKGGEDGGESRERERALVYRSSRNKEANPGNEVSRTKFPLSITYIREVRCSLSFFFSPSKGTFSHMRPHERETGGSRLWIMGNSRKSYRLAKEGNCSLGFSGEIQIKAKNICRDFGRNEEDFDERTSGSERSMLNGTERISKIEKEGGGRERGSSYLYKREF